jgi:hypothetical protein
MRLVSRRPLLNDRHNGNQEDFKKQENSEGKESLKTDGNGEIHSERRKVEGNGPLINI